MQHFFEQKLSAKRRKTLLPMCLKKKKTEIEKNCLFIIYRKLKLEKIGYLNQPKHV